MLVNLIQSLFNVRVLIKNEHPCLDDHYSLIYRTSLLSY